MSDLIQPRTLRGFRDFLPETMLVRERLLRTAQDVYRRFGFDPIDTPALEYAEILLGKGGEESDKQVFRFVDSGDRDVAMRFDLTVPFARFAAQHIGKFGTPFKRYHIGTVWRGERPARGRFREFMQCDFDTIGTKSNASDIETVLVISDLFDALGFSGVTIRVNNRKILNGLLESRGLLDRSTEVLRSLDKLDKIGRDAVLAEMTANGLDDEQAKAVLSLSENGANNAETLALVEPHIAESEQGREGLADLRELLATVSAAGLPEDRVRVDLAIARGLDYYTGTIFETTLNDLPEIGSVCSGGRYDNLAGLFTKQPLPGVGASLGLDRLLAAIEELDGTEQFRGEPKTLVTQLDPSGLGRYFAIASELRANGCTVEVYPEAINLGKQLKFASRRGFRFAVIGGTEEFERGTWQLKDLDAGEQVTLSPQELAHRIRAASVKSRSSYSEST